MKPLFIIINSTRFLFSDYKVTPTNQQLTIQIAVKLYFFLLKAYTLITFFPIDPTEVTFYNILKNLLCTTTMTYLIAKQSIQNRSLSIDTILASFHLTKYTKGLA